MNSVDLTFPLPISDGGSASDNMLDARDSLRFSSANGRNIIHGGNFDTNPWQRDFPINVPNQTSYDSESTRTADRWHMFAWTVAANQWVVTKDADAPSFEDCDLHVHHCVKITQPLIAPSAASSDVVVFRQGVELAYANALMGTWTLSFWVKASVAGMYAVTIGTSDMWSKTNLRTYEIEEAETWEYKTVTFEPAPATAYRMEYDITYKNAILVYFTLYAGDDWIVANPNTGWQTEAGSWGCATFTGAADPFPNETSYFKLALIQGEVGPVATKFAYRSAARELQICQRYCEKSYAQGHYVGEQTVKNVQHIVPKIKRSALGANYMWDYIYFKVPKAMSPTFSNYGKVFFYDSETGDVGKCDFISTADGSSIQLDITSTQNLEGNENPVDRMQVATPHSASAEPNVVNGIGRFHYFAECEPGVHYL